MLTTAPPLGGDPSVAVVLETGAIPLRSRLAAVRRRRLVVRLRGWLGAAAVTGAALTVFGFTLLSLLGH